jgi:hypothetical protein
MKVNNIAAGTARNMPVVARIAFWMLYRKPGVQMLFDTRMNRQWKAPMTSIALLAIARLAWPPIPPALSPSPEDRRRQRGWSI